MLKKFVCLAKSAREGGFCIAGKEIFANGLVGRWFRPIGRNQESLPIPDCTFHIFNVVTCEVDKYVPAPTQPENYKIAVIPNWQVVDTFSKRNIGSLIDSPDTLWSTGNTSCSTYGENDRVPYINRCTMCNSLYFIKIKNGIIRKQDESFEDNQRIKIRLTFLYNNKRYSLVVTDPEFTYNFYRGLQVGGSMEIGPCCITISLSKPYNGYCYKLVAGHVSL